MFRVVQITIRATAPTLKTRKNVVYDVTNVEQHELFGSIPRRDPRTGELTHSSRRRAQPIFPTRCHSDCNRACLPGPLCSSSREGVTHYKSPGERELGVVQEARPWRLIPVRADLVQLCRWRRGSEAEPTTSSRYSSFRGRERSLDSRRLRRAVRHSRTNSASPKGLRRPSAFVSDLRRGKVRLAFCLLTASPVKDRPRYANLSASQWLSRSGIPRPRTLDADLSTDHRPCSSPEQSEGSLQCQPTCLRQKCNQSVKDQGKDVHGACLRPAL